MNGISLSLKDEIKKTNDIRYREKFKFIATILITNILVALLCLPIGQTKKIPSILQKSFHPNHHMMVLPLNALTSENHENVLETPVSLISKDKKMVIELAWLHESIKTDNGVTQFKIEINNKDVVKVSEYAEAGMVAVPYIENKKIKNISRKGSKYEVSI